MDNFTFNLITFCANRGAKLPELSPIEKLVTCNAPDK